MINATPAPLLVLLMDVNLHYPVVTLEKKRDEKAREGGGGATEVWDARLRTRDTSAVFSKKNNSGKLSENFA